MTDQQWEMLKGVVRGEVSGRLPVGFIIDCPWLPGWTGRQILDYFTSDELWISANLKAIREFPEIIFLPGFWSEFGMCTEPSAFGARCSFPPDEFPHAYPVIRSAEELARLQIPDPTRDGLMPFMLNRLKLAQPAIEAAGHRIRFAVSRGPLNIASYLMGMTEFLELLLLEPEKATELLRKITAFLKAWIGVQRETFPTIDGILLLDDVIGFMGEREFREFGLPLFRELYDTDVTIRFLHNDAPCEVSAPFLPEMGVNLFNMGFDVPLNQLKRLTKNSVALMGNLPPREILANGTPAEVQEATARLVRSLDDPSRIVLSCGGGMPPGVSTANIRAFVRGVEAGERQIGGK